MASLAARHDEPRSKPMTSERPIDADAAWTAFERRDRAWDGRVIGAVRSTGIYCKPSCPARRPKRENVEFFATGERAAAAGYRPCLRCRPDEVGRDQAAIAKAVAIIEQADEPPALAVHPLSSVDVDVPLLALSVLAPVVLGDEPMIRVAEVEPEPDGPVRPPDLVVDDRLRKPG